MNKLIKLANFLRLLDENGLLSLTNIAVILILIKVGISAECDVGSFSMLLTALSGYSLKKYLRMKEPKVSPLDKLNNDLDDVKSQLSSIKLKLGINEGRIR